VHWIQWMDMGGLSHLRGLVQCSSRYSNHQPLATTTTLPAVGLVRFRIWTAFYISPEDANGSHDDQGLKPAHVRSTHMLWGCRIRY
jgi:hypothetical protein